MSIYDTIKAQEANFPLPQPSATITVGTFNAVSGDFDYAVPVYHETVVTPASRELGTTKPTQEQFTGGEVIAVNALAVKLRFRVTGRQGVFSVSVQGHGTVSASANTVDVDVGTAGSVTFSVRCNGNEFFPDLPLKITRPMVGAGAITIPALPITIVYAPPVDQQKRNTATWTGTELTGNTTSMSFSEQGTTTVPVASPFQPWLDLTAEMRLASAVLSKIENEYAKIAGAALGVIAGILGTSTTTEGGATTNIDHNSLTVTMAGQTGVDTDPNAGGPGSADVLFFLRNAKILWFSTGGQMKLALVGWDGVSAVTASLLHNPNGPTGLDAATRTALLNLDPFVMGGPGALLAAPRYVYLHTIDGNATFTYTESYTVTNTDRSQRVRTRIRVEDDTASFLAFANIGVTQTVRYESVLTQTSTSETTSQTTITRQVKFFAKPDEYYSVEVYCDVIFGTFAFRSIGVSSTDRIRGRLFDRDGKPRAFEEVVVTSGDQVFRTRTNKKGEFSLRAVTLGLGKARVRSGSASQTLTIGGESPHEIELRRPARPRRPSRTDPD